jgi:hypothetical protein
MSNPEPQHFPQGWNTELDSFQQDGIDEVKPLDCWLFLSEPIVHMDIEVEE